MPTTRLYEVKMKSKKKRYLVEATSREHAVRIATDPLVASVTIPTPLEAIRLQGEGVEILTKATAAAIVGGEAPVEPAPNGTGNGIAAEGGEQSVAVDDSLPEAQSPAPEGK